MWLIKLFDSLIERIETWFIIVVIIMMIFISFLQVVLRNIFSTGISGTEELLRHIVFWTGLVAGSLLTRENRHIKIDILSKMMPARMEQVTAIIINLVSLCICVMLLLASIRFISVEMQFQERSPLPVPIWSLQLILPIGFFMISLRFFLKLIEKILELFR
ncbi:MAG TPA: TRAP transporter small permease [bacterium]